MTGRDKSDIAAMARAVREQRVARMHAADVGSMNGTSTAEDDGTAGAGAGATGAAVPGLADLAETGDADGVNPRQLVEDHLWLVDRLVAQAARRFPRHVERNDLWSAGVLGLVEAARRFDPNFGVPFTAFASARVRGEMYEVVRSNDIAPRRLRRSMRELGTMVDDLTQQLGRVPTLQEVAEAASIDVDVVRSRLQAASNLALVSLDDAQSSASERALASWQHEPSEKLSQQELLGALREAVTQLPEPLRSVLVRTTWGEDRLVDLAEDMGISIQRVAQYRTEAITALAAWFATMYESVPKPDPGLPGSVRRAAFCAALARNSSWQARLDMGVATLLEVAADTDVATPTSRT